MATFTLSSLPGDLAWRHDPVSWDVGDGEQLTIVSGTRTDLFADPAGGSRTDKAPGAFFTPPDETFRVSARVAVEFASTYDAGALTVYGNDDRWAKLCFEFSPQRQPMIVSVVTHGLSDDCNSVPLDRSEVYLRIVRQPPIWAFHYSSDGQFWHLVRYFSLGDLPQVRIGFSQSPMGEQCKVIFSEIAYRSDAPANLRNGE
jgi:regulation of enolase protein 1 (concanavalin A-like superfamily)